MHKYGKDLLRQVICNNLLCSTVDIYTRKIELKYMVID